MYIYIYKYTYMSKYICRYTYMYIYIYTYRHICIFTYMRIHIYIYTYIYIYVYVHIYTYINTIHIYLCCTPSRAGRNLPSLHFTASSRASAFRFKPFADRVVCVVENLRETFCYHQIKGFSISYGVFVSFF